MDIYSAVESRRAVRAFSDQPVSTDVLKRVLGAASRAPSGGNLQPWNSYVLTGASLAEVKKRTAERIAAGDPGDEREFEMYPPDLTSPYRERRRAAAEQRYRVLGISCGDEQDRRDAVAANWNCFGAPAALFCYIDRAMGSAQWADIGMYLQTTMLLFRAEGLHSCPQLAWTVYRTTVAQVVSPPEEHVLVCGMSIGYEDPTLGSVRIGRAPLAETVTFLN